MNKSVLGAKAFIGYTKNYVLLFLTDKETRPLTDDLAKLFLEPSNLMIKNLRRILSSNKNDKKEIASYLWHDIKYQTVIGNNSAKI